MPLQVGESDLAREMDKGWVGVNSVARQIDKMWIGDENGVAREFFSGFTPMFIGANLHNIFKSVDGVEWETIDVPWGTTYKSSWSGAEDFMGMTFGLGKYWIANGKYLCSSEDGDTWTIEKIQPNVSVSCSLGIRRVFYVNGEICAFDSKDKILYITSDGKTWTTTAVSDSELWLKDLVYGIVGDTTGYFWLYANPSTVASGYEIYKSTSLTGAKTRVKYSGMQKNYKEAQIAIGHGRLYVSDGNATIGENCRLTYSENLSSWTDVNYGSHRYFLGSSGSEVLALTINRTAYSITSSGVVSFSSGITANTIQSVMHPPFSPDGTVAFPFNSQGVNCAYYRKQGSTAFTKVTSGVGTQIELMDPYVAVYGIDGGGFGSI